MSDETKKVALPAYLPKRLEAFRIVKDSQTSYLLRDKLLGKTYDFDAWQFFVLEVLPGCDNYPKLISVFEDRFGKPVTADELRFFFGSVADRKLLAEDAVSHPLLAPFTKMGYEVAAGQPVAKAGVDIAKALSAQAAASASSSAPGKPDGGAPAKAESAKSAVAADTTKAPAADETLPAGIQDAPGLDSRVVRRIIPLFDPRPLMKLLMPAARVCRFAMYLLPVLAAAALMLTINNAGLIVRDIERLNKDTTFLEHLAFSLVTVNLAGTLLTAFIAHYYRATVSKIGIGLFFGFVPRFTTRMSALEQLSRRERMWLHGGPLLLRLGLWSLGLLTWYNTRDSNTLLPSLGLGLTVICTVGLLFSANPLVKSSAYHLLAAFTNEPHLRGKSYRAFLNKWTGKSFQQSDSNLLAAYALATFVFMFVVIVVAMVLLGMWLKGLQLGGAAIVAVLALGLFLLARTWSRFQKIELAYQRSQQFDRWRKRVIPEEGDIDESKEVESGNWLTYVQKALPLTLLLLAFLPYPYEAGGNFSIYPLDQQMITSDVPGLVEEVFFDGGETVKKGTPIARLAHADYQSQIAVYEARMAEQRAVINDLKARPKVEEVNLAETAVVVARTQLNFSTAKVPRLERLYKDGAIAFEELETARRQAGVDAEQLSEKEASLALVKTGVTRDRIAAEEAKWVALKEERDAFEKKLARTVLVMPIDGSILTLHLKKKLNSFLDKGQNFAAVENASKVTAEIEIPESDVRFATIGAKVRLRPSAFFDTDFEGTITTIDRNITVKSFGNVIKLIVTVDNHDGRLRTGMTGFAKIASTTMPVWQAFSLSVQRFWAIHVWSWLP